MILRWRCCVRMRVRRGLFEAVMVAALAVFAQPARAIENEKAAAPPRGYVDPAPLVKLAAPHGELIEVTLKGPILKALGKAQAKGNPLLGELLGGLHSIEAVIMELPLGDRFKTEIEKTTEQLEKQGWERLARVRQEGQRILVYALLTDDDIDGLTVFVFEGSQFIFTNIAGRIRLDTLPTMGVSLSIPGLNAGVTAVQQELAEAERKSAERGSRSKEKGADDPKGEGSDSEKEGI